MANTKQTILDAMVVALDALSAVSTATRDIPTPDVQQSSAPFVGVVSMNEAVIVDDGTNIRWGCDLELICVKAGDDIEQLVDVVRDAMLSGMAATVGARSIRLVAVFKVHQVAALAFSEARVFFEMKYISVKGAA